MIALESHAEGVILPVRAKPGAKRNAIEGEHGGALKVSVTAPPEDGRANEAIVAFLADAWKLKRSQITLVSGASSRAKRFLIRGVTPEEIRASLAGLEE
ncbi:MAG TPA: DUF167 domain-containing protein [Isosphaeraceae bacterium]|nr:DUF167 domain-containing protein [Isosphaeraceae bacterium]